MITLWIFVAFLAEKLISLIICNLSLFPEVRWLHQLRTLIPAIVTCLVPFTAVAQIVKYFRWSSSFVRGIFRTVSQFNEICEPLLTGFYKSFFFVASIFPFLLKIARETSQGTNKVLRCGPLNKFWNLSSNNANLSSIFFPLKSLTILINSLLVNCLTFPKKTGKYSFQINWKMYNDRNNYDCFWITIKHEKSQLVNQLYFWNRVHIFFYHIQKDFLLNLTT